MYDPCAIFYTALCLLTVLIVPIILIKELMSREPQDWKREWTDEAKQRWLKGRADWLAEKSLPPEEYDLYESQRPPGYWEYNDRYYYWPPPPWENRHHFANKPPPEYVSPDDSVRFSMDLAEKIARLQRRERKEDNQ